MIYFLPCKDSEFKITGGKIWFTKCWLLVAKFVFLNSCVTEQEQFVGNFDGLKSIKSSGWYGVKVTFFSLNIDFKKIKIHFKKACNMFWKPCYENLWTTCSCIMYIIWFWDQMRDPDLTLPLICLFSTKHSDLIMVIVLHITIYHSILVQIYWQIGRLMVMEASLLLENLVNMVNFVLNEQITGLIPPF